MSIASVCLHGFFFFFFFFIFFFFFFFFFPSSFVLLFFLVGGKIVDLLSRSHTHSLYIVAGKQHIHTNVSVRVLWYSISLCMNESDTWEQYIIVHNRNKHR